MVHWEDDNGNGNKPASLGDRMADYLIAMRRERDAKIEAKLKAGYRPRLDAKGNVVLVKVEGGQGNE